MPSLYVTQKGDTPKGLAIKFYGNASQYPLILQVNPGLLAIKPPVSESGKLIIGQEIIIPDIAELADIFSNQPQNIGSDDPDEVTLIINDTQFKFWNGLSMEFAFDKLATEFSFKAPFEPAIPEYRAAFKPIFQPTSIYIGGKLVVKGQSFSNPSLSSDSNTVDVHGYAITGNLSKTPISEPYEFAAGASFTEIVTDVTRRFGIAVTITRAAREKADKPFDERVEFSATEDAAGKIISLAKERGLIISSTASGRLLVTLPKTEGRIVQAFVSGNPPTTVIAPSFNADALHTSYIGFAADTPIESNVPDKVKLSSIKQPGILPRIRAISPPDSSNITLEDSVRAERGRAFAEWFKVNIEAEGWRDKNGDLYAPNTLVSVYNPRAFIYSETKLFIRAVTLTKSETRKYVKMEGILPEAYSGSLPRIEL